MFIVCAGEITFRELYKMLRHNPELLTQPEVKKTSSHRPVTPFDLPMPRNKVKIDMFKMELQNEVLAYTRSRPGKRANNPTIAVHPADFGGNHGHR